MLVFEEFGIEKDSAVSKSKRVLPQVEAVFCFPCNGTATLVKWEEKPAGSAAKARNSPENLVARGIGPRPMYSSGKKRWLAASQSKHEA